VGAGASGLAAAREIVSQGHSVTVFESSSTIGGLASSVSVQGQPLETFYHHIFRSDRRMISLIESLGLEGDLVWARPRTGMFDGEASRAFGGAADVLRYQPIPLVDRVRLGVATAALKVWPSGERFADQGAIEWSKRWMGPAATSAVWEPLLRGKFGDRSSDVSMAWLWARIHSRTAQLGYLKGGFARMYEAMAADLERGGAELRTGAPIGHIREGVSGVRLAGPNQEALGEFDGVVLTAQQPTVERLLGGDSQSRGWAGEYLGATCFILELDRSFMPYYWLNVADPSSPILAVVEHTNFDSRLKYGDSHVLYVGNYVPSTDRRFTSDPAELLEEFCLYLRRINPGFSPTWIRNWTFHRAPFAQPVMTRDYAEHIPPISTAMGRVFVGNMAQVYPYDRGQNYALETGEKAARFALSHVE
jgi:protoporphyrinogen oxidase